MTTHDHETTTASVDEVPAGATPTAPADPSAASTDPSPRLRAPAHGANDEPQRGPSSVTPAGPSTDPRGSAVSGRQSPAVPTGRKLEAAEHPRAERQTSYEDMLFAEDELADLRARWAAVQAAFVDDPKQCVEKADSLVTDLVDQLTTGFAHARSRLEEQWARGEEASTEDLRVALMHYREFFERLLAV